MPRAIAQAHGFASLAHQCSSRPNGSSRSCRTRIRSDSKELLLRFTTPDLLVIDGLSLRPLELEEPLEL